MDLKRKRLSLRDNVTLIEATDIGKLGHRHWDEIIGISKNQVQEEQRLIKKYVT